MAQVLYSASTGATFFNSLASPALQTVITAISSATDCGLQLKKFRIGFNGTTATNTPVLIRLYTCTFGGAGTNTSGTITQEAGRTIAATNMASNYNYVGEPTVKTYLGDSYTLTPNGGSMVYDWPLGDEPDYFNSGGMGFGLEITPAQQVGVQAALWFTRI